MRAHFFIWISTTNKTFDARLYLPIDTALGVAIAYVNANYFRIQLTVSPARFYFAPDGLFVKT